VVLGDGREITGRAVAANVDPKLLFLELIEPQQLEPDFLDRMKNYRCASATLRMNVALSELPQFACLPAAGIHHQSGIIMAPSLAYMEKAWFDARSGDMAMQPIVEMLIPSTVDDTLAPQGRTSRACSASTSTRYSRREKAGMTCARPRRIG
jgi:phytoene dehydrogenase-like protein